MDQHPKPVDGLRATRAGRGEQRRLERVVHEIGDDLTRPQRARERAAMSSPPPMPIGVAFTTRSAAAAASLRSVQATTAPPTSAAASSAALGRGGQ